MVVRSVATVNASVAMTAQARCADCFGLGAGDEPPISDSAGCRSWAKAGSSCRRTSLAVKRVGGEGRRRMEEFEEWTGETM